MRLSSLIPTTRRSLLVGAGALATLVGTGAALGSAHEPRHGPGLRVLHLLRRLDLTDEQKARIGTLVRDSRPRLGPLMAEAGRLRRAVFESVTAPVFDEVAIRAAASAAARAAADLAVEQARLTSEIRAVLDADQQGRLDEALRGLARHGGRWSRWRGATWRHPDEEPVEAL